MSSNANLITMLDELNLPVAAERLMEILNSPELSDYSPQQLLMKVIEPQYMDTMDRRYMTNLRLSRLINKNAQVADLVTSSARRYLTCIFQATERGGEVRRSEPVRTSQCDHGSAVRQAI